MEAAWSGRGGPEAHSGSSAPSAGKSPLRPAGLPSHLLAAPQTGLFLLPGQVQQRGSLHLSSGLCPRAVCLCHLELLQPRCAQGPVRLRPHCYALQQVLGRPLPGVPARFGVGGSQLATPSPLSDAWWQVLRLPTPLCPKPHGGPPLGVTGLCSTESANSSLKTEKAGGDRSGPERQTACRGKN